MDISWRKLCMVNILEYGGVFVIIRCCYCASLPTNSLAPGRCGKILKLLSGECQRRPLMKSEHSGNKPLAEQCWPKSMPAFGISRPQWVKLRLGLIIEQSAKYNITYTVAIVHASIHHSLNPQKSFNDKFPSRPSYGVSIECTAQLIKGNRCVILSHTQEG